MCFSPEADAIAGTAVLAIGVGALRTRPHREQRALAALPTLLGLHLLVEVPVWLAERGQVAEPTGRWFAAAYLVIALVAVPFLVPLALALAEPAATRRRLVPFVVVGAGVAANLGWALAVDPFRVEARGHHLNYQLAAAPPSWVVVLYLLATAGTALASARPAIRAFGWTNLAAVLVLVAIERTALISLWCAWAAITSAAVLVHLRRPAASRQTGPATTTSPS